MIVNAGGLNVRTSSVGGEITLLCIELRDYDVANARTRPHYIKLG